ncbi:MAG: sn-glycerol-3-phosphate ABC transporter ATP-binding protein UgpC [Thermogemmatispora sp.]|uniref:ABC transporter ATP-binding protein n=1 Tax=Thermogemmatispora sp. TaxID=1968838 RepID=UPI00260AFE82|nr:sn-glycerol-3-phosphate ABC transporter ATP-binding protein UgpC [Thermogemmatispora sp.]MBX5458062.1 sn-glycerol-3-phosphate ABC transporter ATP-binding protein UgpC [Thermogemmatispora sp.]
MARVSFVHVYKRFDKVDVVRDINLEVKDQEFLVLVGPSGCGKSTCLRMIAGLEEPTAGEIYIGDMLVNGVEPKERNVAMVFQNYALYPHMNVFDNMAFSLKLRGVPRQEIKKRVQEAAEILEIAHLLNRKPKELSGGQRQRVALGRAIVRDAQVFLMDEPLSNLDAKLRVQMRAEIIKLHRRVQTTFVYVTHDQVEAMTMGDRIVVLHQGEIQQMGPPQELYDHPANMFVAGFIGSPAMNFFPGAQVVEDEGGVSIVLDGFGRVQVPACHVEKARAAKGRPVIFGIRPEHLRDATLLPAGADRASMIMAPVDVVEHLGSEVQVHMSANGTTVVARLDPRSHPVVGEPLRLQVDVEQIHLFDAETEKAYF